MRIEIACFSENGLLLGQRLADALAADGDAARLERCGAGGPGLRQWVDGRFDAADALLFVGAAGIAVRAVAGKVDSKTRDPAVVVVDECGRFAVSLLSGHLGGANALARRVARHIGATPVVTTATDSRGVFAVDDWARRSGFAVVNPDRIKSVASRLLAGATVRIRSAFPVAGALPEGVAAAETEPDVVVDYRCGGGSGEDALVLVPPVLALGVGCRKNTPEQAIERAFAALCRENGLYPEAFAKVCSVDLKRGEPGLAAFCASHALPFETFAAGDLARVAGDFAPSAFVESVVGVDNVCERSAVAGSGGRLIVGKTVRDGVAMAVAAGECRLDFSPENGEGA